MTTDLLVITGASRGIGAAISGAASAAGAVVAACNRTLPPGSSGLAADLSDPAEWPRFASWYERQVDEHAPERVVFVHNAATLTPIGPAGVVDADDYRSLVLLDSAAPQVLGDAAIRTARRTGRPTVVVQMSSGAADSPYPGWSGYCAAKAAVEMWVKTVAAELGQDAGVRLLAVRPGVVATRMQEEIRASSEADFPQVERFRRLHADGQLADAETVGGDIWELATSGNWSSGAVIDLRQG